jgi:CRISPR-associated endonuclease/helicase Cas3
MVISEALEKVNLWLGSVKKERAERPFLKFIAQKIDEENEKSFFVSAPTGYGKTSLSQAISLATYIDGYRTIIAYPLRCLIEDQVGKFKSFFEWMFPQSGSEIVAQRMMGVGESPYLVHPVVLTTLDTLSLTAVGLAPEDIKNIYKDRSLGHFLFSWGAIWLSNIVMDEVHLMFDSTKSLSFLAALLKLGIKVFNSRIFSFTATLPRIHLEKLRSSLGEDAGKVELVSFSKEHDTKFYEERLNKKYRINLLSLSAESKHKVLANILNEAEFTHALVVFNTVEDAIGFYKQLKVTSKILLHSRFTEEDRKKKIEQLRSLVEGGERSIVVATQTVEAGVDISSDLIITEAAPASSLIQRFGRFLRREGEKCANPEKCAYVWYEEETPPRGERYKVYDRHLTLKTIKFLEDNPEANLHVEHEKILSKVYSDKDIRIDYAYLDGIVSVFTNLTSPKSALDMLLEKEGSLVRDGALFIAESLEGFRVPVSYDFIKKHCIKEYCPRSVRDALKESLSENGKGAFKVNCKYDSEMGLICQGG